MSRPQPTVRGLEQNPEAATAVLSWLRLWGADALIPKVRVAPGPRLRTSLARCYPEQGVVRIRPDLLAASSDQLLEILCHETAHLAVHHLHGSQVSPHGPEWAALVQRAGYPARTALRAALSSPKARAGTEPPRYVHRCPVCHSERTSPRPQPRWRCATCQAAGLDGVLEVFSVAAPSRGRR